MEYLRVRNWREFQHYRDRNPPWIKLHFALLSSPDWVTLDDASRVLAIACMLIASRHNGFIPVDKSYIRRVAYLNDDPEFKPLIDCNFLEYASNTLADASTIAQADARPEERQRRDTKPLMEQPGKVQRQRTNPRPNGCEYPGGCTLAGTRTRSTNGSGPWYCAAHFEGKPQGPIHVTELLPKAPAAETDQPKPNGSGKFDD